ncbi:MAG: hypothetical protein NTX57_00270 [Armatimonadetes bacterium]|nr:hypothetical protein [Armatimonadota bacterium]
MSQDEESPTVPTLPTQPPTMVAVRKRKRRRRSEPQVKSKSLYFMISIFFLVLLSMAVPSFRIGLNNTLRPIFKNTVSAEAIAMGIAGLALLFLIPGVEDRVLTTLGLKKRVRNKKIQR